MIKRTGSFLFSLLLTLSLQAQQIVIEGTIRNQEQEPISNASITLEGSSTGTTSDSLGRFSFKVNLVDSVMVVIQHIEYEAYIAWVNNQNFKSILSSIILSPATKYLDEVEVVGHPNSERDQAGITTIDPKEIQMLPSAFGDFNKVLSTLPGVVSNNELSASYAVRGGNFDENLVYVNDIPIYRPFLVRSGQQEGLSFVNPDLVSNISFSAGGWQAKYGDKLSSSLNIRYKNPRENRASLTLGLLGGNAHVALYNKKRKAGVLVGIRHKNSKYLLNTLETEGEYFPSFTDVQLLLTKEIGASGKTSLEILSSYARNRYLVEPSSQQNSFGTWQQTMLLNIYFQGREVMEYDTYQSGIKLSHIFSKKFVSDVILSGLYTLEREYYDVEGAYRLCDIGNGPGRDQNECITLRGIGSNYRSARNRLDAKIFNVESRNSLYISNTNTLEFGAGYSLEEIEDIFREYSFKDSADFVNVGDAVDARNTLSTYRLNAYVQNTTLINAQNTITYGIRFNYWSFNNQLLISPRVQYSFDPDWERDFVFRLAVGVYQQPAFYREMRNSQGEINNDIRAQRSLHNIVGFDYNLKIWGRNFKWVTEAYYKHLENVVPYEIDNVRLRYTGKNEAVAYAAGFDTRISGEFIKGAESWLSLGIMSTKEDIKGDDAGYVRRPSDQRVNLGIYFQDHIPNDPSLRMQLSLLYGSGLPFGPPQNDQYRNYFTGKAYRRVDIGFSKIFEFDQDQNQHKLPLKSIWIGLEVLNLLGNQNVLSHTWIETVDDLQVAVPNSLSARFLNLKIVAKL